MRFAWIAAVILLAGCIEGDEAGSPDADPPGARGPRGDAPIGPGGDSPIGPDGDPWESSTWSFVDCRYRPVIIHLAKPLIQEYVPPGYVMVSAFGDGVTVAGVIRTYECEALLIGNETMVAPVKWAMTGLGVRAEDRPANATGVESYQFEWFIDNESAAQQLQRRGFDAHFSTISMVETPERADIDIAVAGQTWYRASGVYGSSQAPDFDVDEVHYHGPDYLFAHFETLASAGGIQPYTMTLEAEQGVFSKIGTGDFPAILWPGNAQIIAHLPTSSAR